MNDIDEADLRQELLGRASEYFPELASENLTIELLGSRRRRFSQAYHYCVRAGDQHRKLFVKAPVEVAAQTQHTSGNTDVSQDRPRLVPVLPVLDEIRLEHAGLARAASHFIKVGDLRLGAPRVFDLLQNRMIVIESIDCLTLEQLTRRARWWISRKRCDELEEVFQNVGLWLRTFHQLPVGEEARSRLTCRDEILDLISQYIAYLTQQLGSSRKIDHVGKKLQHHFRVESPRELPVASGHGDFGLHNLFVTQEQHVIGFDTLAYWRTSPYEDIAYFLLLLETLPPSFMPRSWVHPARILKVARNAFLKGYFTNQPIPHRTIYAFEALVMMDKWASVVHSCHLASGARGAGKRGRLVLQQHWMRSRMKQLFNCLENEASTWDSYQESDSAS